MRHLLAYITLSLALGVALAQIHSQQKALHNIVRHELVNRIHNVQHWCGAINEQRAYDRGRALASGQRYTLGNLNCSTIIAQTKKSAQ